MIHTKCDRDSIDFSSFNFILSIGAYKEEVLAYSHKELQSLLQKCRWICLHPLNQSYEIGAEEGVIAMLVAMLYASCAHCDEHTLEILKKFDIGYLSAESNFSEEEADEIVQCINNSFTLLLLGRDLFEHKQAQNILALLLLLKPISNIVLYAEEIYLKELDLCYADHLGTAIKNVESIDDYSGIMLYESLLFTGESCLYASSLFAMAAQLKHNSSYLLEIQNAQHYKKIQVKFLEQKNMSGVVGVLQLAETFRTAESYPFWIMRTKEEII